MIGCKIGCLLSVRPIAHMSVKHSNFKRPCWLALFVSFGVFLLGSYAFWAAAWYMAEKGNESSAWLRSTGGPVVWGLFWLAVAGTFGFVASLIWWFVSAIVSRNRSHDMKDSV